MRGIEPPRIAPLEPKSSASTSSATSACPACYRQICHLQGYLAIGRINILLHSSLPHLHCHGKKAAPDRHGPSLQRVSIAEPARMSSVMREKMHYPFAVLVKLQDQPRPVVRRTKLFKFAGESFKSPRRKIRPINPTKNAPNTSIKMVAPIISHRGGSDAARNITA